jgi:hypothetical protein
MTRRLDLDEVRPWLIDSIWGTGHNRPRNKGGYSERVETIVGCASGDLCNG